MTLLPTVYRVGGLPSRNYLCFRITRPEPDRAELLSLIPNELDPDGKQHIFDVVHVFADDAKLTSLTWEEASRP